MIKPRNGISFYHCTCLPRGVVVPGPWKVSYSGSK